MPHLPPGDGRSAANLDELLALRHLAQRVRPGAHARAATAGGHLSHLHARGVDYAESRVYQPGDDIRVMDWRVTARTGKPHTKLFLEERERNLVLLLDMNPSMRFGTRQRFKSVQMLRVAALAAWMASAAGDRVAAIAFGRVQARTRPRGGARGVLALLGEMLRWDSEPGMAEESLADALQRGLPLVRAGSRVMLLSDGFSSDAAAHTRLMRLRGRADVMAIGIADPLEMRPPPAGRYAVETAGRRVRLLLQGQAARQAFQTQIGRGRRDLEQLCRRSATPLRWLDTQESPLPVLQELLGRARKAGR